MPGEGEIKEIDDGKVKRRSRSVKSYFVWKINPKETNREEFYFLFDSGSSRGNKSPLEAL